MVSDMTIADNQPDEKKNRGGREWSDILTICEMGTTFGRMQRDPGICFHSGYVISHTQYDCAVSMTNCRRKNRATPEGKD